MKQILSELDSIAAAAYDTIQEQVTHLYPEMKGIHLIDAMKWIIDSMTYEAEEQLNDLLEEDA